MQRHEAWRFWYRANRYLRHLSEKELHQRGRETFNINVTLTGDGKVGCLSPVQYGSEAIERHTHYLEECALRGLPDDMGNDSAALLAVFPDLPGELGRRAAAALSDADKAKSGQIFKFGKAKYLGSLLDEGKLRIQAASSFSDPMHNTAVADNEVSRNFNMAIGRDKLLTLVTKHGLPSEFADKDNIEITIKYFTDYWVTCFSRIPEARMAVDFEADAMLAVYNEHEFRRRLRNAVRQVTDYHSMKNGSVQYFDPYFPNMRSMDIPLIKPFKYYYQHEYRFFWLPKEPTETLTYVDIEMGSLRDICDLVVW